HILSFGGTRTYHRMVVNIEDAGFEIRDCITWHYGQGFPKNHDISKFIDKKLKNKNEAKKYHGWGTALTPATELICLARKPISENSIADNVMRYGTGGINIEACRIGREKRFNPSAKTAIYINKKKLDEKNGRECIGNWPKNAIFDEFTAEILDSQSGLLKSGEKKDTNKTCSKDGYKPGNIYGKYKYIKKNFQSSQGGASRFFYVAKPSKAERNMLCDIIDKEQTTDGRKKDIDNAYQRGETLRNNFHPTVKPVRLMQYLIKLITPVGGIVLDPYIGSGTTAIAAKTAGNYYYTGIEKNEKYFKIASARLRQGFLF
ncbi:MAG: DNA methyltransferase, partial [Promethearchaeia archaeon]